MPKLKKLNFKKTLTKNKFFSIFTLIILIFAVLAGILLVQQNQNIKERAGESCSVAEAILCNNEGKGCKDGKCVETSGGGGGSGGNTNINCSVAEAILCNNEGKGCKDGKCNCSVAEAILCNNEGKGCKDGKCVSSGGGDNDPVNSGCSTAEYSLCVISGMNCKDGKCITTDSSGGGDGNDSGSGGNTGGSNGAGGGNGGAIVQYILQFFFASIDIKGGVIAGDKKFTKEVCPNTDFVTDVNLDAIAKLKNKTLTAVWDCIGPDFTFYQKRVKSGDYKITLVPPAGYSCESITVNNRSTNEIIKTENNTCSIDLKLKGKTAPMYIQYEVKK
ncbi:MAG: hypothetical protein UR35_C0011G0023 [Candidatus Woesebacteria bacterium GW2011_GWB1_33_22]|uniref:Uncharacterized protein n=1 Tax=Candidatus Woesebacteria bacterium GW2011_GWB1_33_22 TaxID=1618566 RepID=A0A0G0CLB6_9BACT|nr:MAG: hypothetical protein UR35_C0011G0023 [Candidatus Woesebacteria bacterium GW2011_GWB1_33_22]